MCERYYSTNHRNIRRGQPSKKWMVCKDKSIVFEHIRALNTINYDRIRVKQKIVSIRQNQIPPI